MRVYVDFWIKRLDTKTLETVMDLGYSVVLCENAVDINSVKGVKDVAVISKVVIESSSRKDLLNKLKGIKSKKVVVSVKPLSLDAARTAAHDTRVDTLIIDSTSVKFMDKHQFNLLKQFSKPIEFPLNVWLKLPLHRKTIVFQKLYAYIHTYKLPFIVSSGASAWNEVFEPRSIVYYISNLFGVIQDYALLSITSYPKEILIKNGFRVQ